MTDTIVGFAGPVSGDAVLWTLFIVGFLVAHCAVARIIANSKHVGLWFLTLIGCAVLCIVCFILLRM